jgi:hypothetical protein
VVGMAENEGLYKRRHVKPLLIQSQHKPVSFRVVQELKTKRGSGT